MTNNFNSSLVLYVYYIYNPSRSHHFPKLLLDSYHEGFESLWVPTALPSINELKAVVITKEFLSLSNPSTSSLATYFVPSSPALSPTFLLSLIPLDFIFRSLATASLTPPATPPHPCSFFLSSINHD